MNYLDQPTILNDKLPSTYGFPSVCSSNGKFDNVVFYWVLTKLIFE